MKEDIYQNRFIRDKAFINGKWCSSFSTRTFPVVNPFDGTHIVDVPDMTKKETTEAIKAAYEAFPFWSSKTAGERANIMKKWYQLLMDNQKELAQLITLEQGKPLAEAEGEVAYGASFIEWFAEEAKRIYGDVIPGHQADKRIVVIKQPIGVVAAITPWNFPIAMITRKVAPALAAGCTVVIKPAEDTPLSALALAELSTQAGFPPGIFNIITTSRASEIGLELTKNPLVKKLSFTGSTRVGKLLMRQCADTVKKVSLELGGDAPFIVFKDADLDDAVNGAVASKYRNAGQTCVCANRFFVQNEVYQEFLEKFKTAVEQLKMDSGFEKGVTVGPLINKNALTKVQNLVNEAIENGATIITGGKADTSRGNFYEPTILGQVTTKMKITREEIFGPIAPVFSFETEEEVIKIANDTPYGLAAYFYGRDIGQVWRVAEGLQYGMVGINTGMISTPVAPFGGIKESGIGREGSKYGIEEFTETKYLCFGGI